MSSTRRRTDLGEKRSAALPSLWKALGRKGWSLADLARALEVSTAYVSGLAYGDYGPGRKITGLCHSLLGVRPLLWDKPCPASWRPPHAGAPTQVRSRRQKREAPLPPTGTD